VLHASYFELQLSLPLQGTVLSRGIWSLPGLNTILALSTWTNTSPLRSPYLLDDTFHFSSIERSSSTYLFDVRHRLVPSVYKLSPKVLCLYHHHIFSTSPYRLSPDSTRLSILIQNADWLSKRVTLSLFQYRSKSELISVSSFSFLFFLQPPRHCSSSSHIPSFTSQFFHSTFT
jgi:hypothetical protein